MEAAIRRGDITWHANPLNSEDEVYDADTLRAAIDVSHELNARFGRANSRWVGQEDDPGGTRGIIPVLAEKGVKGFYVGYNDGSMNLVPLEGAPKSLQTIVHDNGAHSELFAWRWVDEASKASTIALFHTSGHGGTSSAYPGTVFDSLATNTLVIPGSGIAVLSVVCTLQRPLRHSRRLHVLQCRPTRTPSRQRIRRAAHRPSPHVTARQTQSSLCAIDRSPACSRCTS